MRLFRIEHPEDAAGPYFGDAVTYGAEQYGARYEAVDLLNRRRMYRDDGDADPHPVPDRDGIDFTPGVHRSAFDTLEKLADWFHEPARALLAEAGFVGAVIEVPDEDVQVGQRQAAYVHDTRRLIDVFDLRSLPMAN